jgi:hypothetical protein
MHGTHHGNMHAGPPDAGLSVFVRAKPVLSPEELAWIETAAKTPGEWDRHRGGRALPTEACIVPCAQLT